MEHGGYIRVPVVNDFALSSSPLSDKFRRLSETAVRLRSEECLGYPELTATVCAGSVSQRSVRRRPGNHRTASQILSLVAARRKMRRPRFITTDTLWETHSAVRPTLFHILNSRIQILRKRAGSP